MVMRPGDKPERVLYRKAETAYRDIEGYDWDQGIDATHLSWCQSGYVAGYADAVRDVIDVLAAIQNPNPAVTVPFTLEVTLERVNAISPAHVHAWVPGNPDTETPYVHCRRCRARKD